MAITGTTENCSPKGMSLRDYFAAAALPALVATALDLDHVKWDATAEHAYIIADAMIKERGVNGWLDDCKHLREALSQLNGAKKQGPTCREYSLALGADQAKAMGIPMSDELLDDWIEQRATTQVPLAKEFQLPKVAGRRIRGSNDDFERACLVHIERLQDGISPYDGAMLDTFCEAVRLVREYNDSVKVPPPTAPLVEQLLRSELELFKDEAKQLQAQLEQEKKWKVEDPRMLREQIRVADVAFNHLLKEHQELLADKVRLDWMEQMRVDCEGHVLTRVFMPGENTLRDAIDGAMSAEASGIILPAPELNDISFKRKQP